MTQLMISWASQEVKCAFFGKLKGQVGFGGLDRLKSSRVPEEPLILRLCFAAIAQSRKNNKDCSRCHLTCYYNRECQKKTHGRSTTKYTAIRKQQPVREKVVEIMLLLSSIGGNSVAANCNVPYVGMCKNKPYAALLFYFAIIYLNIL